MGTQDTGAEDTLSNTVHTGTKRDAAGKNIASRPTYYTRREPGAPNSPEEGGAVYPPREPPNVLTPRAAGGIGRETKIEIKQGHKAPNQDPERNEIRGTQNKTDVQRPNEENSITTTRPQRVEQEESCLTHYNPKEECPE